MELFLYFIVSIFLIVLGYISGVAIEASHYRSIEKREREYINLPVVTSKNIEDPQQIIFSEMVSANIVISLDHFKRFLASLRQILGGRIKSYETMLDRGRREAILRMKDKAKEISADLILNARFQTLEIGQTGKKGNAACFEILVYGTAVRLRK